MSFLQQALDLASKGFYVFPLQADGKLPAIDDFPNRATRDPEQIKKWWLDPILGLEQPYNIGISTTRYNGSQALVVVDVDNKGSKKGDEELLRLELEGYDFVETATQVTPTGGLHLIYRAKEPVKQGTSVLANGLDIRSRGGYIVGHGSVINGKPYTWRGVSDVKPCPEWIINACGRSIEKESIEVDVSKIDQGSAEKRAKYYLEKEAPLATEGEAGDQTTFKVAARLKDFGLDTETAFDLMAELWNPRCLPPWDLKELHRKIQNAYSYSQEPVGSKSPQADFEPIREIKEGSYLEDMNKQYALVFLEDSHMILFETQDEKGRPKREFLKEASFKRKFSPYTVQQGRGSKTYADIWLDWEGRREFAGLCFRPEQTPQNNYYNLWRGFAYKSTAYGDAGASAKLGFDMFIEHAKTNVCKGDEKLFTWLMGYYAHMIQHPYERPLTTLVFRGTKGVGKNAINERVGKLLGAGHFLTAHDSRYLTSNFNGHLDSCLMLVLDEAFWSGDKQAEGKLKGITTAPEIMIERKGKEPYMVDNLVRLVVIGNEDWLVPASYDERRYAVFDVGEGRKKDGEYFHKMRILMDQKGGAEILMHYLKNFDLKSVDVNDAPHTSGLADQKHDSLSPFDQFWLQCLIEGKITHLDFVEGWTQDVDKKAFRKAFSGYCKERNIKSWSPSEITLSRDLKRVSPSVSTDQKHKFEDEWRRVFRFADLDTCRKEWDKRMGFERSWE